MASSTSVLATARIASRSSTPCRPISCSLLATALLLLLAGGDGVHQAIDEFTPCALVRVRQPHGLHQQEAHAERLAELGGGVDIDIGRNTPVPLPGGDRVGHE